MFFKQLRPSLNSSSIFLSDKPLTFFSIKRFTAALAESQIRAENFKSIISFRTSDMEFEKLIDIALGGLEELKENPAQVPEGFVLVPIKPTETMVMAVVKEHEGDAFLPYSLYDAYLKQAMIEAQEQSHD